MIVYSNSYLNLENISSSFSRRDRSRKKWKNYCKYICTDAWHGILRTPIGSKGKALEKINDNPQS